MVASSRPLPPAAADVDVAAAAAEQRVAVAVAAVAVDVAGAVLLRLLGHFASSVSVAVAHLELADHVLQPEQPHSLAELAESPNVGQASAVAAGVAAADVAAAELPAGPLIVVAAYDAEG